MQKTYEWKYIKIEIDTDLWLLLPSIYIGAAGFGVVWLCIAIGGDRD